MADVAWFTLGNFTPIRSAAPPQIAVDTARFRRHRTIFISDTHLGTRGCKAETLADFLAHNDCDTLFLVGDIVDGWQIKRRWFWTEAQGQVVAQILHKVDRGTRVIFVPGNHDEFAPPVLRDHEPQDPYAYQNGQKDQRVAVGSALQHPRNAVDHEPTPPASFQVGMQPQYRQRRIPEHFHLDVGQLRDAVRREAVRQSGNE